MPFGLGGASATFQRVMQTIFRDELLKVLIVYLDDIIVFSQDIQDPPAAPEDFQWAAWTED